jgi:transposase
MSDSIRFRPSERKTLLQDYRRATDPALRLRAHIILLLGEGHSWAFIASVLFCSTRTIARWKKRFDQGRGPALLGKHRGARSPWGTRWLPVLVRWVTKKLPTDFGFLRSRWCCETLVLLLVQLYAVVVSRATVRRWLHRGQLVWRRPRPVVGPKDPQQAAIVRQLRRLLAHLPEDETAVFQDEVDINSNPKIGSMWMLRGQQADVPTPGTNAKRYLSGPPHDWWTPS